MVFARTVKQGSAEFMRGKIAPATRRVASRAADAIGMYFSGRTARPDVSAVAERYHIGFADRTLGGSSRVVDNNNNKLAWWN